jgi:hypothetical protein
LSGNSSDYSSRSGPPIPETGAALGGTIRHTSPPRIVDSHQTVGIESDSRHSRVANSSHTGDTHGSDTRHPDMGSARHSRTSAGGYDSRRSVHCPDHHNRPAARRVGTHASPSARSIPPRPDHGFQHRFARPRPRQHAGSVPPGSREKTTGGAGATRGDPSPGTPGMFRLGSASTAVERSPHHRLETGSSARPPAGPAQIL